MIIKIHPELQSYFRPLSAEELADLEALMLREGMTEPLYLWKGQDVLLDGHHRYLLCQKHDLSYSLPDTFTSHFELTT
jgi:ParB-like chromosome segregation protein Spo0J